MTSLVITATRQRLLAAHALRGRVLGDAVGLRGALAQDGPIKCARGTLLRSTRSHRQASTLLDGAEGSAAASLGHADLPVIARNTITLARPNLQYLEHQ